MLWLFLNFSVKPHDPERAIHVDDTHESFADLLNDPQVIPDTTTDEGKAAKDRAPALCGAEFAPGAKSKARENVLAVHWLVLDVDNVAIPFDALKTALSGLRAIIYTSASHTPAAPKYRVLVPLASPLPPSKYRALVEWLSANLVPGYPNCINADATGDPGRLGYVCITAHPEHYFWERLEGELFDWTPLALEDEAWTSVPLGGFDGERNALWSDRATALKAATRHFAKEGLGLKRGQGRSMRLWIVANKLWWEWAAEDSDFVLAVLRQVNHNFAEPEDEDDLDSQMRMAHARTIGERRRGQSSGTYGWRREPQGVVTREAVKAHAVRLIHRRNPEDQAKGFALRRLLKGETLSDDAQEHKGLLTKVVHELARLFFYASSVEQFVPLFEQSVSAMAVGVPTFPTMDEVKAWLSSSIESQRKYREERVQQAESKVQKQIEFVMNGERDSLYTSTEVDMWKQTVGLRDNAWILVSDRVMFVFRNGTWVGPYSRDEFEAQGYKDLAAAQDVGVVTRMFSEKRQEFVYRPMLDLLRDYGSRCTTKVDLNCDRTYFDVEEKTLILAGPPKRAIVPTFHEEIDEWFRVMTSRPTPANINVRQAEAARSKNVDDYDVLCDWLACLTHLDRPCAALYLQGRNDVGKGLFVDGVARLWKQGAIDLVDVVDDFNSLITETPLVWVDEGLAENVRASVILRKIIAAREFVYKRKHKDAGKVLGCIRMVFTANNLDLFNQTKELVKKEDVDALAPRFAHIAVNPAAVDYLASIAPRHEAFVEKNQLAEHAMWLAEKRWGQIKLRGARFLVQGRNTTVSDVVATNADSTSLCCTAICEALVEGKKTDWLSVKKTGELSVNAIGMKRAIFVQGMQPKLYTDVEITRAVSSISDKSKTVRVKGKPMRMWVLRTESLKAWCDYKGVFDWADVKGALDELAKKAEDEEKHAVN